MYNEKALLLKEHLHDGEKVRFIIEKLTKMSSVMNKEYEIIKKFNKKFSLRHAQHTYTSELNGE